MGSKNPSVKRKDASPPDISAAQAPSQPPEPFTMPEDIARQRGVPKTPQGWWTFGLTVMVLLIAVALWFRYH